MILNMILFLGLTTSVCYATIIGGKKIMILIISYISSFEIIKVIPFFPLTTPHPCIFLRIASSIAEADITVANSGKIFLA